jgi:copper-containing nitrite reductase
MPSTRRSFLASALALTSGIIAVACAAYPDAQTNPAIAFTVGQSRAADAARLQPLPLKITASSFHMDPSAFTLPVGRPVQLTFQNQDTVQHQITITGMPAKVLDANSFAKIKQVTSLTDLDAILSGIPSRTVSFIVDPGQTVVATFVPTAPGTFDLQCQSPGHRDAGMISKVFVTAPSNAATPVANGAVAAATAIASPTAMPINMPGMAMSQGVALATATPTPHQAVDPTLLPIAPGTIKDIAFKTIDTNLEIAPGVTLAAWTFDGRIPGPFLHLRQGDTVRFTLTNGSSMPHSIDFHAARTAPNVDYKSIAPGESYTFTWQAADPGAFLYHCGTAPMLQHLAEGMYGGVVVDAVDHPLPPVDRAFAFVQGEYYLTAPDANGIVRADLQKATNDAPDEVVFNGYVNQYMTQPIEVKVGEKIRIYLVNAGPNHFSAFHVVGTIFDHVWVDGNPNNDLRGVQTWTVAPGEGAAFDFVLSKPGNYSMVTHSFADAGKGAMAVFKAQ